MKRVFSSTHISKTFILLLFFSSISYTQEKALYNLIEDSDIIIIGSIRDIKCQWENGNIWTYVSIEPDQTLKGTSTSNEITIRSLGGSVGEISQKISEGPEFVDGEILLGFLKKDKTNEGIYYCIGGGNGKYNYKDGYWIQKSSKQPEGFVDKIKNVIKSN